MCETKTVVVLPCKYAMYSLVQDNANLKTCTIYYNVVKAIFYFFCDICEGKLDSLQKFKGYVFGHLAFKSFPAVAIIS